MELDPEVHDPASALANVGGDPEFLREIAGLIQAAWPTLLGDIRKDLAAGDLRAVQETAGLAKAAAKYVSARRAYVSALPLETMVGQGDMLGAQRATAAGGVTAAVESISVEAVKGLASNKRT